MAEAKTSPPTATAAPQGQAAGAAAKPKLTKMAAVRRALTTLGKNAKPLEIQAYIKKKYDIEMGTDHISTYKGDIARKKAKAAAAKAQSAASATPAAAKSPAAEPAKPAAKSKESILLEDVLTAKALLDRVGAERLRLLINGLAK